MKRNIITMIVLSVLQITCYGQKFDINYELRAGRLENLSIWKSNKQPPPGSTVTNGTAGYGGKGPENGKNCYYAGGGISITPRTSFYTPSFQLNVDYYGNSTQWIYTSMLPETSILFYEVQRIIKIAPSISFNRFEYNSINFFSRVGAAYHLQPWKEKNESPTLTQFNFFTFQIEGGFGYRDFFINIGYNLGLSTPAKSKSTQYTSDGDFVSNYRSLNVGLVYKPLLNKSLKKKIK